jgi:hypothetical protein
MTKEPAGSPLVKPFGHPEEATYCDGPHTGLYCRHCVKLDGSKALSPDLYAVKQLWFMGDCSDRDVLLWGTLDEAKRYVETHQPYFECGEHFEVVQVVTGKTVYWRGEWSV